jgi:dethiobiotin synthetase
VPAGPDAGYPRVRPRRLVVVAGTGTDVGKTWVAVRVVAGLIAAGQTVSVRKPAQSFEAETPSTDADLLAAASGESPLQVCAEHRWYPVPMAPPMAAVALGRAAPRLAELADEITASWPSHPIDIGVVEAAGGVASPQADDGDTVELCRALDADLAVLVADPGLGTINAVRLGSRALAPCAVVVYLNRFDNGRPLHRANRDWLADHDRLAVITAIPELIGCVAAAPPPD